MSTVCLSYTRLLREVCEQLPTPVPACVLTTDAAGLFSAYMDIPVPGEGSTIDIVRCWGARSSTSNAAEQSVARAAIKKMVTGFGLQVKDVNYDDYLFYKNIYEHLSVDYNVLAAEYDKLSKEYNLLKKYYISAVAKKNEYAADRSKISQVIEECHMMLRDVHPANSLSDSAPSDALSGHCG